jgi:rhamnogalacturonan endolyase
MRLATLTCILSLSVIHLSSATTPFFITLSDTEHVIGNDLWNITIGRTYGTKLFYKNKDIVGNAAGHYLSYSISPPYSDRKSKLTLNADGGSFLNWTSARIHAQTNDSLDVAFEAPEGDFHWVIYHGLAGAYQYFINKALPVLGEFRTLVRLDNTTFFNGKTASKEGKAPTDSYNINST